MGSDMMLMNFRDVGGGEPTIEDKRVATDRLFRSGHMAGLDHAATAHLIAIGFAAVIDLRYADEREKDRSPWPPETLDRVVAHDGTAGADAPHLQIIAAALSGDREIDDAYAAFYAALPFDRWYRPLFADALRRIAATSGRVLIHCTAGKDRTGVFVALLLDLLGVPRAAIVEDYMRSRNAPGFIRLREDVATRMGPSADHRFDEATMDKLVGVEPAYIVTVFEAIEARCGSVERYFLDGGVDADVLQQLRGTLLTD